MRLIFLLLLTTSFCFAQDTTKIDTLVLTSLQIKELNRIESEITKLKTEQLKYLKAGFDAMNIDADRVKDIRFDNGKLIYKYE